MDAKWIKCQLDYLLLFLLCFKKLFQHFGIRYIFQTNNVVLFLKYLFIPCLLGQVSCEGCSTPLVVRKLEV